MTASEARAAMQALPVQPIDALLADGPPLILAPHPDDESLGCGGIIAACCAAGRPPFVVVLTDGTGSHPNSITHPPARLAAVRAAEARVAVACLGLSPDRIAFLGLPDTRSPLDPQGVAGVAARVAGIMRQAGAGVLLAPWASDPHCDHLSAHRVAATAATACGVRHLAYPVWGLTLPDDADVDPVRAGMRVDVSAFAEAKRQAILSHRSQYAGLITDDPAGFQMQPGFMALFSSRYEVLIEVSAPGPLVPPFLTEAAGRSCRTR